MNKRNPQNAESKYSASISSPRRKTTPLLSVKAVVASLSAALFTSSSSLLLSALVPDVLMLVLPGAAVNQLLYPATGTPPAL